MKKLIALFCVILSIVFVILFLFLNSKWQATTDNGSYHISQFIGGIWMEQYVEPFTITYQTKTFIFSKTGDNLVLRFEQKTVPFGDIEMITLNACGNVINPNYAKFVQSGKSVLDDIKFDDHNVIVTHNNPIEIAWTVPDSCNTPLTVTLKANEYNADEANHFRFPERGQGNATYSYIGGANITVDGLIKEVDGIQTAQFSPFWITGTGHPAGYAFFYLNDDANYIYLSADITPDNTDDYGADWIELTAYNTITGNPISYRVTDLNNTFGYCSFGLTSKVTYKHQACEIRVPKSDISGSSLQFSIQYYGTAVLQPTSTPMPTNTPKPTSKPKPKPTSTPTPTPTVTPTPTLTPTPTPTPTPVPTANLLILGPDGIPVKYTSVIIDGQSFTTDVNGNISMNNFRVGSYRLLITIGNTQFSQGFVLGTTDISQGYTININNGADYIMWGIILLIVIILVITAYLIAKNKKRGTKPSQRLVDNIIVAETKSDSK